LVDVFPESAHVPELGSGSADDNAMSKFAREQIGKRFNEHHRAGFSALASRPRAVLTDETGIVDIL
jgi:hypothetical protein